MARTRFDRRQLPAYAQLMNAQAPLQPGETVTLGGRRAVVLDVIGVLVRVRLEGDASPKEATVHAAAIERHPH